MLSGPTSENLLKKKAKKRVHRSSITLTDAWVLLNSSARLFVRTSAGKVATCLRVKGNQSLFDNCMIRDDLPVDSSFPTRNFGLRGLKVWINQEGRS